MFVANLLTQNSTTHYLDVAQEFGLPGDVCPMPEAEAGISIDDEKVADDMARLTDGAIQLDLNNFIFERFSLNEPQPKRNGGKKRK